jgi:CHAT domain-containing protein/tetratricopeptide (TPR) repeat protein
VTTLEQRAEAAQRNGQRAGNAGHPAVGARLVRSSLAELGWRGRDDQAGNGVRAQHRALTARLLITLAHLESEQGRVEYGLGLLDEAEWCVVPLDRGYLFHQRGLLLLRTGRWADALAQFTAAEPLLNADREMLAAVLLNRGVLHLNTGDLRRARSDLRRAGDIAVAAGLELVAAKTTHNLGYCELLSGDIPSALHLFDEAAAVYARTAPGNMPVLETDRARALIAAGLACDAISELDCAITAFRRQRLHQYCAEAELTRAQAALATGDLLAARRWSTAAIRRFRARGNEAWAALAELTRLRAGQGTRSAPATGRSGRTVHVAIEAQHLAGRLRTYGLRADAALAELIAARALIATGRRDDAARRLTAVGAARTLPLEVALFRRLVSAEFAALDGHTGRALAELRGGLAMLHTRRGQLGSLDLQTGAAALGAELADKGLQQVLDRGSARQVFAWLERSRAQAFRVRPVRPPADPEEAAVLAELRQLSSLIRTAELNGAPDLSSVARRAELQRLVRQRSWQASGLGEIVAETTVADVGQCLAENGQVFVGILVREECMLAVTIKNERVQLVHLGGFAPAAEAARRLTADLDALAGRRLPSRLETVIRESVQHQTKILADQLVAPLLPAFGDSGAVIAPTGALAGIPWSLIPGLRGRPVTVAPSASSWLAARRSVRPATAARPLLVAGPDLHHAIGEVTEIAAIYPGSRPLTGQEATVEATLRALDGAELAHLAAHGHHDRDNVLFSRLDLADGPLMAYDIQRLSAAPNQVVISACDVGRTVVRAGDEILGFTAALLHIGTPTVISSVTRVADDAAVGVMTAYHRALRSGARPAEALAAASETEAFSPFVCFGAG